MSVVKTNIKELSLLYSGKVRDVYELDSESLLFIATDRISAFDVIMSSGIPGKGRILTRMSKFWFDKLANVGPSHLISDGSNERPFSSSLLDILSKYGIEPDRCMVVKRLKMVPIEAIVRGFITGSAWREYKNNNGIVCGIKLPEGLSQHQQLPEVVFTPSTKAENGIHDENCTFEDAVRIIGDEKLAIEIKRRAIQYYNSASEYAKSKGILIADTKMEFGIDQDGNLCIGDEIFTPDCSRFWQIDQPDRNVSFDKQFVRDWLESVNFDKQTPLDLPQEVTEKTFGKYSAIYSLLTGENI